jgi:hypothetical protein
MGEEERCIEKEGEYGRCTLYIFMETEKLNLLKLSLRKTE